MRRRSLILGGLGAAPLLAAVRAHGLTTGALRVGTDIALFDSGLARALQQAFGRDTGIGVRLIRSPVLPLLESLSAGELDAGLANAPEAEAVLDRQGLVYDRRFLGTGEFVLVGPAAGAKARGRAGVAGGHDVASALGRLRDGASGEPGSPVFLSANDGSGAHVAEQAAWRLAGVAPQAPWYRMAVAEDSCAAQARARGAYAIVERAAWSIQGGAPLAILVDGDARLTEQVHAMRSFRSPHPAGKLFMAWIGGAHGRTVVGAHRGYRVSTS